LQGTADDVAPVATADEFATALPELVTYERFEEAGRAELWNQDPERYSRVITAFVSSLADEESP
jgi:hypothetical protein